MDCNVQGNDVKKNELINKSENAGFSLVEVILAMAILAILTISLLNYFGNSIRYNIRTASDRKAILLAQEISEELKGQDTLIQKKTEIQPDGSSKEMYTIPFLLDQGYEVTENDLNTEDESLGKTKGMGTISFRGKSENIGKNYDVTVTVKASEKAWDKSEKMYGFDNTNSVLAVDDRQDDEAFTYFKSVYSKYCDEYEKKYNAEVNVKLSDTQIRSKIKRTINLDVNKVLSEYVIDVGYIYNCSGLDPDNGLSQDSYESNILSNSKISQLKKIYILYHAFSQEDFMEIRNTTIDVVLPDLYLVCQKTDAGSLNLPPAYKMNIKGLDTAKIYSNIGTGEDSSSILENGAVIANIGKISEKFAHVNMASFEVSVYEKGKSGEADSKPYSTIKGTKGEKP